MLEGSAADVTIGVAVGIPQPHSTALQTWRRRVGDPAADVIWPHVTLLPPTAVPADELPAIEAHLAAVAAGATPFSMHLAGTGTFRPTSPVVFVQISRGVSDCELLEKAIRSGSLRRELEFPYHPHVTVAHEISDRGLDEAFEGLSDFIARFRVDRFGLFVRHADGSWSARAEYPLGRAVSD